MSNATKVVLIGGTASADESVTAANPLPVSGTFSATLSGFTPNGNVANLSVTTSSGNVALPAGTVVAVVNSGANDCSIKLSIGAGSAATTDFLLKSGATVGLTVGSNTYINAITASSTTTLNIAGGSGLVTGYGGGSSGGGGGNVTVVGPLGSAVSASSVSVVVASDQAAIAVKQATASNLNAAVVGVGTAGTPSGGLLSIQGASSMTPVAVTSGVAQQSSTSGQSLSPLGIATLSTLATNYGTTQTNLPIGDVGGQLIVSQFAPTGSMARGTGTATDTSAHSIMAASGSASLYEYVTGLQLGRSDAGTSAIVVTLNDSASSVFVVPNAGNGGVNNFTFNPPLRVAKNTAVTMTSGTSVSTLYGTCQGYYGP